MRMELFSCLDAQEAETSKNQLIVSPGLGFPLGRRVKTQSQDRRGKEEEKEEQTRGNNTRLYDRGPAI